MTDQHVGGITKFVPAESVELFELDGDKEGGIRAVFSVFNVKDRHGDIVRKEAFRDGEHIPLVWSHDWKEIIGRGVIKVTDNEAIFEGSFFIDQEDGAKRYKTVKSMAELMQWSWGFEIKPDGYKILYDEDGYFDGFDIFGTERFEVSPVLVGANQYTRTLEVKSAEGGMRLDDNRSVAEFLKAANKPKEITVDQEAEEFDIEKAFPHDDDNGEVDVTECLAIITRLNGGKGYPAALTGEQRKEVYEHVANHVRESGATPPELRDASEIINEKNSLISYIASVAGLQLDKTIVYDDNDAHKFKDILSHMGIKGNPRDGMRFTDEADDLLERVKGFTARVEELVQLRGEQGRRVKWVDEGSEELQQAVESLLEILNRDSDNQEETVEQSDEKTAETEEVEEAVSDDEPDTENDEPTGKTFESTRHEHMMREMKLAELLYGELESDNDE